MKKGNISDAVIRRLPRYYRQLAEMKEKGIVRISSQSLGEVMKVTASQIRQDFSCFGEFGQQGYGYNVTELQNEISHILGIDQEHHLIIIGVGNLGRALLNNFPFSELGVSVDAAFDLNPALDGIVVNGVPVHELAELETYVDTHRVDLVVLTVPQAVAQPLLDRLVKLGIRGFWNFTNVELSCVDPEIKIEDIHFSDSLMTLSYRIVNR